MAEDFKTLVDISGQISMYIRSEKQDEQTTVTIYYCKSINKTTYMMAYERKRGFRTKINDVNKMIDVSGETITYGSVPAH